MRNFKFISALLVAMLMVFLVGCSNDVSTNSGDGKTSGKKAKGKKINVGIVLPTKDEPRWVQDEATFQGCVKRFEVYDRNFV